MRVPNTRRNFSVMNRRPLLLLAILAAGSCSHDATGPGNQSQTGPGLANGSWVADGPNFIATMGLSDVVVLATGDGTVGGAGSLVGPGVTGGERSVAVRGYDSAGAVRLSLHENGFANAVFTGQVMPGDSEIHGTLDSSGFANVPLVFKQHPIVTSLVVTPRSDSLLTGHTTQLGDSAFDMLGRPLGPEPVVWGSDNNGTATVSATGVLTGKRAFQVTITADYYGVIGQETISILRPVASVVVSPPTVAMVAPGALTFTAIARDSTGAVISGRSATWSSANTRVAQVSSSGAVTATDTGTADITARITLDGNTAVGRATIRSIHITQVAAGTGHTCAIDTDGTVACWGDHGTGQPATVANPGLIAPVFIGSSLKFAAISSGNLHTCGLTVDSTAYCWGDNAVGQLGNAAQINSDTPVVVAGGLKFIAIAASDVHTCGLVAGGAAYCWGNNNSGQLGTGATIASPTPSAVSGGLTFTSITVGGSMTCGLIADSSAYCWGSDATGWTAGVPTAVTGGLHFASITTGGTHTCGIVTGGAAYCWGSDLEGALGDSATSGYQTTPVAVNSGGVLFTSIAAGSKHTCALATSGQVYCWGRNDEGEAGPSGMQAVPVPMQVGLTGSVVVSGAYHSCTITPTGAYCWGFNSTGQLGAASTAPVSATPLKISGQP